MLAISPNSCTYLLFPLLFEKKVVEIGLIIQNLIIYYKYFCKKTPTQHGFYPHKYKPCIENVRSGVVPSTQEPSKNQLQSWTVTTNTHINIKSVFIKCLHRHVEYRETLVMNG